MCCCPKSNSLCVTFVIGKVSTGIVLRGVRCGESGKKCLRPSVKNCRNPPSGVSLLYPKQCIAMETVPCDHPIIFHEFCLCTAVGMSAKWSVPVSNLSLLVMLCLVFVGECIRKVINFKWLNKNINADTSNLIGKAKFVVAVFLYLFLKLEIWSQLAQL